MWVHLLSEHKRAMYAMHAVPVFYISASLNWCVAGAARCLDVRQNTPLKVHTALHKPGKMKSNQLCQPTSTKQPHCSPPPPPVPQDNNTGVGIDGNSKDGWLIYDEEAEFVRQGLIKPKSLNS